MAGPTINPDGRQFCTYCRLPKDPKGFKPVKDKSGRLRNYKCADCLSMKLKPQKTRDAIAERRRSDAKEAELRRMKEITLRRTGKQFSDAQNDFLIRKFGGK